MSPILIWRQAMTTSSSRLSRTGFAQPPCFLWNLRNKSMSRQPLTWQCSYFDTCWQSGSTSRFHPRRFVQSSRKLRARLEEGTTRKEVP
ncbi:hypothetical protein VTK73DRAFT_10201 [Phialemonium thermophilum]|uniref:Uncharacterized protein n=1 Tax=Phialemonium thermophilum TaxID=223376 RepID=A0ABR3XH61_9PEZI